MLISDWQDTPQAESKSRCENLSRYVLIINFLENVKQKKVFILIEFLGKKTDRKI